MHKTLTFLVFQFKSWKVIGGSGTWGSFPSYRISPHCKSRFLINTAIFFFFFFFFLLILKHDHWDLFNPCTSLFLFLRSVQTILVKRYSLMRKKLDKQTHNDLYISHLITIIPVFKKLSKEEWILYLKH